MMTNNNNNNDTHVWEQYEEVSEIPDFLLLQNLSKEFDLDGFRGVIKVISINLACILLKADSIRINVNELLWDKKSHRDKDV